MRDQATNKILYQGLLEDGLYRFQGLQPAIQASTMESNVSERVSKDLWHARLGHSNPRLFPLLI